LAIIGVHAGKYIAERETPRIREAMLRLRVEHPVVNDRQYRIWRSFAVRAWPTLVVIEPGGGVLGAHAGEFTADMLTPVLQRLIDAHKASIDPSPLGISAESSAVAPGGLRYPGKIAVDGGRLAIADSGHHRVLVGDLSVDGKTVVVRLIAGDGEPGFVDGASPRFQSPQGLAFAGETLYVADTENHAVRGIDLGGGAVRTIAGTGHQVRTRRDQGAGALSSPWDLAVLDGSVFVAMAGTHQIFVLRGEGAHAGAEVAAGTGAEDISDGLAGDALLAQPMGISSADGVLYFADAESSAIRVLAPDDRRAGRAVGELRTLVGTGLFDFGDRDGEGEDVRLQHPQGVAVGPAGRLIVADSYNDALKWLDPATRRAETWLRGLHEPGGVGYDPSRRLVYVADTNAHRVLVVDPETREQSDLVVQGLAG
jgi:DNA-binding beta-propeller fold protein YncE